MTRLLLTRHGETEWNVIGRVQGWTDTKLNAVGEAQAAALAERLRDTPIAALYSSDSSRAVQTAQPTAERHSLTVQRLPELREKSFGVWEGLTQDDLERDYADLWHRYHILHELDSVIPGGETYTQVLDRMREALCQILDAHPGADETVLVVSHGGSARAFILFALQAPLSTLQRLHLDNTSLSRLDFRSVADGRVIFLNDTSHLTGDAA
jgi:broad specificity phosphatase PhoE